MSTTIKDILVPDMIVAERERQVSAARVARKRTRTPDGLKRTVVFNESLIASELRLHATACNLQAEKLRADAERATAAADALSPLLKKKGSRAL